MINKTFIYMIGGAALGSAFGGFIGSIIGAILAPILISLPIMKRPINKIFKK